MDFVFVFFYFITAINVDRFTRDVSHLTHGVGRSLDDASTISNSNNAIQSNKFSQHDNVPERKILSGIDNKNNDAITYPDDVPRDSYGNPVTPYSTLSTNEQPKKQQQNVGFFSNINKNGGDDRNIPTVKPTLNFSLPSYADGITQIGPYKQNGQSFGSVAQPSIEFLPPFSSLEHTADVGRSVQHEATKNIANDTNKDKVPRFQNGLEIIPSVQTQLNGNIGSAHNVPLHLPSHGTIQYNKFSGTDRFGSDRFGSVDGPVDGPVVNGTYTEFTQQHSQHAQTSPSTSSNTHISSNNNPTVQISGQNPFTFAPFANQQGQSTRPTLNPPIQPSIGPSPTPHQNFNNNLFANNQGAFNFSSTSNVQSLEQDLLPPLLSAQPQNYKPNFNQGHGNQQQPQQQPFQTTRPAARPQVHDNTKYTGGFGGSSGILGNQNRPGYAIQPDGSIRVPTSPPQPSNTISSTRPTQIPPSPPIPPPFPTMRPIVVSAPISPPATFSQSHTFTVPIPPLLSQPDINILPPLSVPHHQNNNFSFVQQNHNRPTLAQPFPNVFNVQTTRPSAPPPQNTVVPIISQEFVPPVQNVFNSLQVGIPAQNAQPIQFVQPIQNQPQLPTTLQTTRPTAPVPAPTPTINYSNNPFLSSLIHNSGPEDSIGSKPGVVQIQNSKKPFVQTQSSLGSHNNFNSIQNTLSNRIDVGKYTGSFGGPPGILAPYDNTQGRPGVSYSRTTG